jgi:VWFA-related protein
MRTIFKGICLAILALIMTSGALAQSGRGKQRTSDVKKNQPPASQTATPAPTPAQPETAPAEDLQQDVESVKVDTNLVAVPVIASDRNNIYVPDMRQEEFTIEEDGVKQEVVFFASTTQPFHVVLMLDTSASTQDKLGQIQRAATAFVNELQPADRVKLISFDDQIIDYGKFTNDREALRSYISRMRPGKGTKLYDAMALAIDSLRRIEGRKAIVIFTDGVDWYSDRKTIDDNRRELEEAGIIVYPIRYDTREEVERMVRQQQRDGRSVDLSTILGGGSSSPTTPTTFPGGSIPLPPGVGGGGTPKIGPVPIPPILIPRRDDPNNPNDPNRVPSNDPFPVPRNDPTTTGTGSGGIDPNIDAMLDMAYATADGYLRDLALITGGKLHRADTLGSLPAAFANIAAELRTQYSLGYYPTNAARDGKFRKLKVRTTRKDVIVRARPGYRAPK